MVSNDKVGNVSINLLASTDWMLVEMDGKPLPAGVTPPTALVEYGAIKGFAGCNRYTAKIAEPQAGAVKIDAVAAQSDKACDASVMQLQEDFLQRLAGTGSYSFQAGRLLLAGNGPDGPSLLFSR
jgi:heat shock protein HslJ